VSSTVVLLHGFAATPRQWDRTIAELAPDSFTPVALDITTAAPLTADGVSALVAASADERFVLAGYSMGARLALHTALAIPARITRLVLLSASAGIEDDSERAARRAADESLAASIEQAPIESFVKRWRAVALFAGDPDWVHEEVAADERRCDPSQLAACLRGLGAGAMTPMWERLGELRMPVEVLAGADDPAYVAAGARLAAAIPDARLRTQAGVGHRLPLQAPQAVARALAGT
jgi:2-succinyl-6-hydroxy-2,4-cyclohexadiene-1-carboxylate synthase